LLIRERRGYSPNESVLLGLLPASVDGVLVNERMSLVEKEASAIVERSDGVGGQS
jgi:hypothetical protein